VDCSDPLQWLIIYLRIVMRCSAMIYSVVWYCLASLIVRSAFSQGDTRFRFICSVPFNLAKPLPMAKRFPANDDACNPFGLIIPFKLLLNTGLA
jgi:hypothetical protein